MKCREPLIRKQSLHLLKTVLDAFDKGMISIDQSLMSLQTERKQETLEMWSHYVIIMESLNEKQVT